MCNRLESNLVGRAMEGLLLDTGHALEVDLLEVAIHQFVLLTLSLPLHLCWDLFQQHNSLDQIFWSVPSSLSDDGAFCPARWLLDAH